MSYNDDKRELLKLKQGLIEESDVIPVDEKGYGDKGKYEIKGFKNKLANFLYQYKLLLIVIIFFAAVISFLVITTVNREKGDVRILLLSKDPVISESFLYKNKDFETAIELYTPDFDENGYVHVDTYNINLSENQDANYLYMNNTKLFSEVQLGVAQIFIGDMEELTELILTEEGTSTDDYMNLSELYPDDPRIADKYYYQIKNSPFAEAAMYGEGCPENIYMVIRKPAANGNSENEENHKKSLEVLDNIIKDNKVSEELPKR